MTRNRICHFPAIVAVNHAVVWMIFQSKMFTWVPWFATLLSELAATHGYKQSIPGYPVSY